MAQVSTIYLTTPAAPGNKDFYKAYISGQDATGVWTNDRDDGRGNAFFFPMHQIQRIQFNTGWGS